MTFDNELDFEQALIGLLTQRYGWEKEVLHYPSEEDLLRNWANILFQNNKEMDKLNDVPLTEGEMKQVLRQFEQARTPARINDLLNGPGVSIQRDAEADALHYGKNVVLKLYDRQEIGGGKSRYQIAEQPRFSPKKEIFPRRRGDFTLLINGMPLIHVELKRSGVDVSQACYQIQKYAHERVFTGLFSLVQIFVAMNPDDTVYFANPGPDGNFNPAFYFHWADRDNEPIRDYDRIAETLLSIPMAHQLIGFYTVADGKDGVLKVMRSYQYFAANFISRVVAKRSGSWGEKQPRGGYVWHTTGSGKTMTSFKSAQLIAESKNADKVIFLTDRVELGTQSLGEYRNFAREDEEVQGTDSIVDLVAKLKSDKPADTLIVTSINKMSEIGPSGVFREADIQKINRKRMVIIVDEAHRSVFGNMMIAIRRTFPYALFFGFTGTPIQDENKKKDSITADVFGNELHRYSLADGIRDRNVLGFDPCQVHTFKDKDLRQAVALEKAKAQTVEEAMGDEEKKKTYLHYMEEVPMAGDENPGGGRIQGIEDYVKSVQYDQDKHRKMVVKDIRENWPTLSRCGKFHALLAASSIPEAIQYYRLFKDEAPELKVSALFDPNTDGRQDAIEKEDAICEIIQDYNVRYGKTYTMANAARDFRKDVTLRLAHKFPYEQIEKTPDEQLDLLIVVQQLLTGFDSKWINTLYLDKKIDYEEIIQAFSRTNRIFGEDKPFGNIRYYRYPNTMERNIKKAVALYSGDRVHGLFVEKLSYQLRKINEVFHDIEHIFHNAGIEDFSRLPDDKAMKAAFARRFRELNQFLEAAKIQGFSWEKREYEIGEHGEIFKALPGDDRPGQRVKVTCELDETIYLTLALRYKELFADAAGGDDSDDVPYEIDPYLTEIKTERINVDYINSHFTKYLTALQDGKETEDMLAELHSSFARLSKEKQDYAEGILLDVKAGRLYVEKGKTFQDYLTEYEAAAYRGRIRSFAENMGLDEKKLFELMQSGAKGEKINDFARLDHLEENMDREKARAYLEKCSGKKGLSGWEVSISADKAIRDFVNSGGRILPGYNKPQPKEEKYFHTAAEQSDRYDKK